MFMQHQQGDALASAILETVPLPLLALDAELRVESANDAFLSQFQFTREETIGRSIYDLGNGQWDILELRRLLGEILPERSTVSDYRVEHDFERIGRRIMNIGARRIVREGGEELILLAISDDTERETLRAELKGRIELADEHMHSVREGLLHGQVEFAMSGDERRPVRVRGALLDGTEQKLSEEKLRESESRLRFLAGLDEALRAAPDAPAAMLAVAERLALHLGSSRCAYADVDADSDRFIIRDDFTASGVESTAGTYSLDLFGPRAAADMRAGHTLVIHDVAGELGTSEGREMFLAIGIEAIVCLPLIRNGRLVAMMAVHQDKPRNWRQDEVALVEATVERCWVHVERVSAEARLRDTSRRLEAILGNTREAVFLMDENQQCVFANAAAETLTGYRFEQMKGRPLHDVIHHKRPDGSHYPLEECPIDRAFPKRAQMSGEELFVAPDGSFYPVAYTASPMLDDAGQPIGTVIEARNISEEKARAAALAEREERYRTLFTSIDQGFCLVEVRFDDGRTDYRVVEANPAFYEKTGFPEAIFGRWLREAAPHLEEHWYEIYGRVAQTGDPARFEQHSEMLGRWFDVDAFHHGAPEDRHVAILFNDITERKRHEEHTQLLLGEINHRSKNMLSLVLAIARASINDGSQDFMKTFRRRVMSLSANQDLLVSGGWQGVSLRELVSTQLAPFEDLLDGRLAVGGPSLVLSSKAAETLGMALHELATNAGKHGALSSESGRIVITWALSSDTGRGRRFQIEWRESGGPKVASPARAGFGTRVIKEMAEGNLAAEVRLDYAPSGLVWELDAPADHCLEAGEASDDEAQRPSRDDADGPSDRRGRILIVEDEAIIAFELAEELKAAGHEVIGPAASVRAALALLEVRGCDAAVLDVNLGKETSAEVAEALAARRIPFVAVSGYSRDQLPKAMMAAPLFSKPLRADHLLAELSSRLAGSE